MKTSLILFVAMGLLLTWTSFAESGGEAPQEKSFSEKFEEKAKEIVEEGERAVEKVQTAAKMTRINRSQTSWTVLLNYSLLDLWVPSKFGISAAYSPSPDASWELEYLGGSLSVPIFGVEIGKIEDQRISLLKRSYAERNSFNFLYGINYSSLQAKLSNKYLSTVGGSAYEVRLMEINTWGVTWGVGNRWQTKGGFVWGFDWFVLNVPLIVQKSNAPFVDATNNSNFRDDVKRVLKAFERAPTLALAKVQLGLSF